MLWVATLEGACDIIQDGHLHFPLKKSKKSRLAFFVKNASLIAWYL